MKKQFTKKISKIAVVGMSGIFPDAFDTPRFIDNILNKKNCVSTVPDHRWAGPVKEFISNDRIEDKAVCDKAGLIRGFSFDSHGFLLDKDFLSSLDPVHQLVLQAGRDAFLQCSHTTQAIENTGVILAAIALPTDASSLFSLRTLLGGQQHATPVDFSRSSVVSLPAALLASAMGFKGGSFTLDAACASSLFAIKLACEHLHLKKADIMVAGGVSRPDSLYTQIGFTQLQALSPTGICAPFDTNANGLVVGEGTGIVVLKRLDDAIHDQDTIYAVINGTGASNDIEGTLVGPASEGQQRAMLNAYHQAGWSVGDIQYMECHGSGTPVGDQVELSSIHSLLKYYDCPDKDLSIGSVKSNIGHLLTAAGAAGFIKTVLSMNNKTLPPSLNFQKPSSKSILNNSNIHVQTDCSPWEPASSHISRKAGISAFGFGGINAHVLIEEYKPDVSTHVVAAPDHSNQLETIPCAIIGMNTQIKDCDELSQFNDLLFGKTSAITNTSKNRDRTPEPLQEPFAGLFIDQLKIQLGDFHIPPNQMDDILPQHILLLKAAKGALEDAGIPPRPAHGDPAREKMGCAIGIDFDYGATDYYVRWRNNSLDESLKDAISPALTFNRTLGALGGIVASRVAREFKLGGPSFTLSADMASGIKAIETGIHSLSNGETSVFICGSVDLAGDLRQLSLNTNAGLNNSDILPSEGAAAIVLKPLDLAIKDKDKIYGVIKGIGSSGGGTIPGSPTVKTTEVSSYIKSLNNALSAADISFESIDLYEACLSGNSIFDQAEKNALQQTIKRLANPFAGRLTATSTLTGNSFGVSSLLSVIKTCLCLYQGHLSDYTTGETKLGDSIGIPANNGNLIKKDEKSIGCVASTTLDGACSHLIVESPPSSKNSTKTINSRSDSQKKLSVPGSNIVLKTTPRPFSKDMYDQIQQQMGWNVYFNDQPGVEEPEFSDTEQSIHTTGMVSPKIDPSLIADGSKATADAHQKFLDFSVKNMKAVEDQFATLTQLASQVIQTADEGTSVPEPISPPKKQEEISSVYLNREQCMEFAIGKAGAVLGKEFDIIDAYPVRVRLPDEPLMLVDRIMDIQGEMLSLGSGKIITQHDVKEGAWYLDGNKAPVCISIEAGQADLFLCSWLGIDHVVKGQRKYRLLDASVTFHRGLPEPGETIEYHIEIDRFLKQGEVYLFFFHYKGYIGEELLISMRDGCAGFFTEQEVKNSGGIILKTEDTQKVLTQNTFSPLVPCKKESFTDEKITSLRNGDLARAFGDSFNNVQLGDNLALPSGRMKLIDRVLEFDPDGGRYGLGSIIAEADIHPDDWFLTCHFIDDMVMPGTLMYECCAHALRIFTQRIGWVSEKPEIYYDVLGNNESELKCRGPVTPETKKARYEIEIKEIGYMPEPYIIADAHMFSDDHRIVLYKDMGMKLMGITQNELDAFWRNR